MKKLCAILMALCLMLPCAAFAEGAVEVNWSDVEGDVQSLGLIGNFVTFDEIAVKIWIPASMQAVELSEEAVQAGYIGYFAGETAQMAVVYVNVEGITIDEYARILANSDGIEQIAYLNINGLPGVRYQIPENDSLNIAFATEAGYILELTMAPLSAEGADITWGIVGASIQEA